jgi:hypothetical protein
MPTLAVNRKGYIVGTTAANQVAARDITTGTATDSPSGTVAAAIQWFRSTGRGGSTMRYIRTFLHFDTSGITDTLSACDLNIRGNTNTSADVIGIKSTAFGGDGGTALASGDMDAVDYGTAYSSENASWSTSGNALTLTAAALADIKDNDNFTIALVEHDSDYQDTDTSNGNFSGGVAFGSTIELDYTVAASTDVTSVNTIAKANITSYNSIAAANIDKLNTLTF